MLTAGDWIARLRDEDGIHEVERGSTHQPIQLLNPRTSIGYSNEACRPLPLLPPFSLSPSPDFRSHLQDMSKLLLRCRCYSRFSLSRGLTLQSVQYRLCACLIHDGLTQPSGHYRVILSAANDAWFLKNDHRPVGQLTFCQAQALCESRGYLLLYCRADDHAVSTPGIA